MITTIIKRNGRKVKFQPEKLNKLADWAADHNVEWSEIALNSIKMLHDECTVQQLVEAMIQFCIEQRTENHLYVAGKLFAGSSYKSLYNSSTPWSWTEQCTRMHTAGLYNDTFQKHYSPEEMVELDSYLDHSRDFKMKYTSINQLLKKYAISNRITKQVLETPQFICMRIAMEVKKFKPVHIRMTEIKRLYDSLSLAKINIPTPNWLFIGTVKTSSTSCCIAAADDNIASLTTNDHISYMMTVESAGIGNTLFTRSEGSGARNNTIVHQGKIPYFRNIEAAVHANLQSGRGGAATTYINVLDPEIKTLIKLRNQTSVAEARVAGIDYAVVYNDFFCDRVAADGPWLHVDYSHSPELWKAMYEPTCENFERIFKAIENDPSFPKIVVQARSISNVFLPEQLETGRNYEFNSTNVNSQTPFLDPILSSNLCTEVCEPTKPYKHITELYETDPEKLSEIEGEIALCNLAGIVLNGDITDEDYLYRCYDCLDIIAHVIDNTVYVFPQLEYTAKNRMSAGVGLMNLAYEMARNKLFYSSTAGKQHIHSISERHMYMMLKASIMHAKERGNAGWIHKTKYPQGWVPMDSFKPKLGLKYDLQLQYNWDQLRQELVEVGGGAFSCLVCHMPGESSSQVSGSTNSVYMIKEDFVSKTDTSIANPFIPPRFKELQPYYEIAWDVENNHMADCYGLIQRHCDQAISADYYYKHDPDKRTISLLQLTKEFLHRNSIGCKTKYYSNNSTHVENEVTACGGGGCTL